jgi:hypothetical protein
MCGLFVDSGVLPLDQSDRASVASWFEGRGVAALLSMRIQDLILRSGLLAASRRMQPPDRVR